MPRAIPFNERLLVDEETGCWLWQGAKDRKGYGWYHVPGTVNDMVYAHRHAYVEAYGPIPEGKVVMHLCNTPSCCNPAHLKAGTQQENIQQKHREGRANTARGEQSGLSKLTTDAVIDIRNRRSQGEPLKSIAADYGITDSLVSLVALRKVWQHIP